MTFLSNKAWHNNRYIEYLSNEAQLMALSARNRPPMSWNGSKPLKFQWALFVGSKRIDNIAAYNIEEGWYSVNNRPSIIKKVCAPFLVKRLS